MLLIFVIISLVVWCYDFSENLLFLLLLAVFSWYRQKSKLHWKRKCLKEKAWNFVIEKLFWVEMFPFSFRRCLVRFVKITEFFKFVLSEFGTVKELVGHCSNYNFLVFPDKLFSFKENSEFFWKFKWNDLFKILSKPNEWNVRFNRVLLQRI